MKEATAIMKYIVAIVKPERVNSVLDKLEEKEIHLATATTVMGRGRQKGLAHQYRGLKATSSLIQKVKLEIAINDEYVETVIEAIESSARTDQIGDGKIFVLPLEECVRIRTAERGTVAIG